MTVTSFFFLIFLLGGMMIYYIVPKRGQWVVLLGMSLLYYMLAAVDYTIFYLVFSTLLAYISSNLLEMKKVKESPKGKRLITIVTMIAICFNILLWFVIKGSSFWILGSEILHSKIPAFPVLMACPAASALGMGYYTAQIISYIMDCYWETCRPQRNFLKLFLFVAFFPQLTVGPISRYSNLQSLYEKHEFSYQNLCFGSQRILWGFFKKLVISDRINIITSGIWADTATYGGKWPWIAVFLYPVQLYTDFSGCMDIILGAAELFDIRLPENFNNPFFSRTVQEFWQRWHITLGGWAKDYVYYPVLKSAPVLKLGKWAKKHFKKRIAKLIPWTIGMIVLWFIMGFWHGSLRHIFGVSLWFGAILVIGEFFSPVLKKMVSFLKIDTECFSWHLFQSVRTYILYALGAVFFSALSLKDALQRYAVLFDSYQHVNLEITVYDLGVAPEDITLIVIGIAALFVVAALREKFGYARIWMQKQLLPFRWLIWLALFVVVLIYGLYGPSYDASTFIYEGF